MVIYSEPDFRNLPAHTVRLFDATGEASFFAQTAWYDLMARNARPPGAQMRLYLDSEPASVGLILRTDGDRRLRGASNAYTMEYGPIGLADKTTDAPLRRLAGALAAELAARNDRHGRARPPGAEL